MVYDETKDPKIGRGNRIRSAIDNSGLKRVFIANELDISTNAIQKWQRSGDISTLMAIKLCNLINADLAELFFGFPLENDKSLPKRPTKSIESISEKLRRFNIDDLEIIESIIDEKLTN